jgi:hypothetical protein
MFSRLLLFGEIDAVYYKNLARLIIKLCRHIVASTIEGAISFETSANLCHTTRRHIPRDSNRHWHRPENTKYQIAPQLQIFFCWGGVIITLILLLLLGNLFVHRQHHKNQLHYSVMSQFSCILLDVNIFHLSWLRLVAMPLRERSDPRLCRLR